MASSRRRSNVLALLALMALNVGLLTSPAQAATEADIVDTLDQSGRYMERSADGLDDAIDEANRDGIAFVWLAEDADGPTADGLAAGYADRLVEIRSRFHTVFVLTDGGFGAFSDLYTQPELDQALDASFSSFRSDDPAGGLDMFTDALSGSVPDSTPNTTTPSGSSGGSGGGGSFGTILLGIAVLGGGFFAFRAWRNSRRRKAQAEVDMEEDRAEIKEQLRNNADRVISLGDQVIAKDDRELIALYEEASASYQEVSLNVETAETAEEIDALDDRIDHAEWQFSVIEAKLDGRPIPPEPVDEADLPLPPPPAAPPAPSGVPSRSGSDTGSATATSPRTGRQYPRSGDRSRSRGGGLGGLGGGLGSILGSIILGGGLGGNRSRRSQRRSGGLGGGLGGGILGGGRSRATTGRGGGLGGGVLRRGGGSKSSSPSRSRTRSRGGRTTGRTRSRGGRSF